MLARSVSRIALISAAQYDYDYGCYPTIPILGRESSVVSFSALIAFGGLESAGRQYVPPRLPST